MQHHLAYRLVMTYIKPQVKGGIQTISRNLKEIWTGREKSLTNRSGRLVLHRGKRRRKLYDIGLSSKRDRYFNLGQG